MNTDASEVAGLTYFGVGGVICDHLDRVHGAFAKRLPGALSPKATEGIVVREGVKFIEEFELDIALQKIVEMATGSNPSHNYDEAETGCPIDYLSISAPLLSSLSLPRFGTTATPPRLLRPPTTTSLLPSFRYMGGCDAREGGGGVGEIERRQGQSAGQME
ncbi:hypothetical protein Sjap_012023 [Stephania japonica]|uniref:Uncharacterized protein n=1 Tax=Stephania japonica TaxID=461633 RepID=A0AAP0JE83_9MAGN